MVLPSRHTDALIYQWIFNTSSSGKLATIGKGKKNTVGIIRYSMYPYAQFFAKEKLPVSQEFIEGTIHCKPGAAKALLEQAYSLLTKKE